ncbi:unnamed protein product [Urochloa decumbens]|uniref:Uncharacterized protein n=1 Tax=Urochloa decumbens TaxID=240449 RepID=A0ABC8VZX9_9POAL
MNGKKRARGGENKDAAARAVPLPAASDGDAGATQPPAARKTPLPPDAAAPPADDGDPPAVEIVEGGGGGGVEEEVDDDDDEQVERFYALLANIRAMRGLLPPYPYASCAGGDAGSRKRLRAAEPPWRPAFRMEDFEVVEPHAAAAPAAPPSKKTKTTMSRSGGESASGGARPAGGVVAPSSLPHAAARSDSGGSYKD